MTRKYPSRGSGGSSDTRVRMFHEFSFVSKVRSIQDYLRSKAQSNNPPYHIEVLMNGSLSAWYHLDANTDLELNVFTEDRGTEEIVFSCEGRLHVRDESAEAVIGYNYDSGRSLKEQ